MDMSGTKIDRSNLLYHLGLLTRRWRQILDAEFNAAGLTDATWRPLLHLHLLGDGVRQKELAGQFAKAGATLVVGTHPHVLQPAEWIEGSNGRMLVFYSLGNALFDQGGLDDTRQSALVLAAQKCATASMHATFSSRWIDTRMRRASHGMCSRLQIQKQTGAWQIPCWAKLRNDRSGFSKQNGARKRRNAGNRNCQNQPARIVQA